jgi:hypothetical protein
MRDRSTYRAARRALKKETGEVRLLSGSSWRKPFPEFDADGNDFIKYRPRIPRSKYMPHDARRTGGQWKPKVEVAEA